MLPLLYRSTDPIPAPGRMQYIGRIAKCVKCTVSERINSDYQLSLVIAPTDELIGEVQNQRFIFAKPNPFDDPQYFEIYNCVYDQVGQLTISARHIKHCAYNNITVDIGDVQRELTPQTHWNYIVETLTFDNYYTFSSTITSTAAIEIGWTKAGTLGQFLEELASAFGGEYHYNNFQIDFPLNRGEKKNYVLRWNKNIGSPKLTLTTANIYSHVVAIADVTFTRGADTFQSVVFSAPHEIRNNTSQLHRIYLLDANDSVNPKTIDWSSSDQRESLGFQLERAASKFARMDYKNQVQYMQNTNLTVNFRPALDEMSAIGLGDTVDVMLKGGRTVEAKIMKTVYNVLSERWESIELGQELLKLSDYIAKTR